MTSAKNILERGVLHIAVVLFLLVVAMPLAYATQSQVDGYERLRLGIDSAVEQSLKGKKLVGGVVLVAHKGRLVHSLAAGYADREAQVAMQSEMIFRLSSVSKVYVSMAAAVLIDQGRLALDDPVSKWLPYFTPVSPDGSPAVMTVRQLLSHTSGLGYGFDEPEDGPYRKAGISAGLDLVPWSLEENLRRLAALPLYFRPGTQWRYSLATDVLGAVIEKSSGMPLPQAVDSLVCAPLGLRDSSFYVADTARLAVPYRNASPQPFRMKEEQFVSIPPQGGILFSPGRILSPDAFPSGGAGMTGTAPDLLRLLETMRSGGTPLVSEKMMHQLMQNAIGDKRVSPGVGFALGWSIILDPQLAKTSQSVGTIEWGGVYGHTWFVDPQRELTVVVLTNTAFEGMSGKLVKDIKEAVYVGLP